MLKNILKNKSLKYISFWVVSAIFCLLVKFFFNLPGNLDLIFGGQILLASFFGPITVGAWSAFNIISYDWLTGNLGIWSLITSISYFLVSLATSFFINFSNTKLLKKQNYSLISYLVFTVLITVTYDLVTATTGPLLFGQAWLAMLVGQIPFTLIHVISNCASTSLIYGSIHSTSLCELRRTLPVVVKTMAGRHHERIEGGARENYQLLALVNFFKKLTVLENKSYKKLESWLWSISAKLGSRYVAK